MADFCHDCVIETFDDSTLGPRNDFYRTDLGVGAIQAALCEGCGWHFFSREGVRLCDSHNLDIAKMCGECVRINDE